MLVYALYLFTKDKSKSDRRGKKQKNVKNVKNIRKVSDPIKVYNNLVGYQNDTQTDIVEATLVTSIQSDPEDLAAIYSLSRLARYNRQDHARADQLLDTVLDRMLNTDVIMEDYLINAVHDYTVNPNIVEQAVTRGATNRKAAVAAENTAKQAQNKAYFRGVDVFSDSQNVHDRAVNSSNNKRYNRLLQLLPGYTTRPDAGLEEYVKKHGSSKAYDAFQTIQSKSERVQSYGDTEYNVLSNVWHRIQTVNDPEISRSLKVSLLDQLDNCIENGLSVCSTGRTSRIMDTFTKIDPDPVLSEPVKTISIIRKEVFDKAYNYIQTNMPEETYNLYTKIDPTPEEEKTVNTVMENIKEKFTEDIRKEYEGTDIDRDVLDTVINEAKAGF